MKKPANIVEIFLQPGEFYFGDRETRIRTILGSCVAVTLWHPGLRIGGMCHYMLPARGRDRRDDGQRGPEARYADEAMKLILWELKVNRTRAEDYEVKLFGGSSRTFPAGGIGGLAAKNAEAGKALMAANGFRVAAQDLAGGGHRNIIFDLWSGAVWVRHWKGTPPPEPSVEDAR